MTRHRRRRYRRRGRGRGPGRGAAAAVAAGVILAVVAHRAAGPAAGAHLADARSRQGAAAAAITYARAQLGKPYLWGGTGPGAFDCSGLVQAAYAAAGISIPRTSQEQWASLPHVASGDVRPGDLVLSGTEMIQAYATGVPVELSPLNGDGAGGIVGYARPAGVS